MRRYLLAVLPLVLSCLEVAAQTPASLHLPWDVPSASAGAHLESLGFSRRGGDDSRFVPAPGGGFRRAAGDPSVSTYTRSAAGVSESVFMRLAESTPAQIFYSAIGDSATLHAKLDAVAADAAGRMGPASAERGARVWRIGGSGRLVVPSRPSRLPNREYQFFVLFHQAPATRSTP